MSCLELALEFLPLALAAKHEITVEPLKVAVNVLERRDCLNAVDRGRMAFGGEASAVFAVELLDPVVSVIERSRDVSGRTACLTAADGTVVDDYDRPSGTGQQIGGSHARDAGSDDTDVCPHVLGNGRKFRDFGSVHPDGGRVTRVASHSSSCVEMVEVRGPEGGYGA